VTQLAPLLANAFVNPALLGGLGLVIVPIVIHLLSRRQFRRIEWGATRFLLEAEKENRRRVRFEQWLLVALRCLALALAALLVARPFVRPGLVASLLGGRGQVHRVILIDDSASLAFRTGTGQDFAALREAALRLLGWLYDGTAGDPVSVYLTSQPNESLASQQPLTAAALQDLRDRVRQLEPTNLPARPRRALEKITDDLRAAGPGRRGDVYVLSDFQRDEWLATRSGAAAVFEPLEQLDPDAARVVLIAAGAAPRDNVTVLDPHLERPQIVAGLPTIMRATVVNYAREPLEGVRVQVEVDGAPRPSVLVETIVPGESRTVSLEVTFPDEGFAELVVGVEPTDGLAADNTRRLALAVKRSLAVLLINGEPATDPVRDEVYFLRNALAPTGPFSSGIRVQTIDPEEIEATLLEAFDCIALCNVAPLDEGAVAALRRYAHAGGGLLLFLGDQVGDPDNYNRVFGTAGEDGVLPLRLKELVRFERPGSARPGTDPRAPRPAGVGLVRRGHDPVMAMFPADGASPTAYVRFRTYYRCDEPNAPSPPSPFDSQAPATAQEATTGSPPTEREGAPSSQRAAVRPPPTVLAHFNDGARTPALVERPLGRGRVLLFTSSVDLEWNDWARAMDGSYVVTMLELVHYAARRSQNPLSFVAGERLTLSLRPEQYEPRAVFRSPAYPQEAAVPAQVRSPGAAVGEPVLLEGPLATRLGTYTAELATRDGGVEPRPLAVNLDPAESDLTAAAEHELDAALADLPHEYALATEAFLHESEQARRELWPAILITLVAILMLEQTLAWWFGLPTRGEWLRHRFSALSRRFVWRAK
jgi:hypothetical protein